MTRRTPLICSPLLALMAALPAFADQASLLRLSAALRAIQGADKALLVLIPQLQGLEGVRLDRRDVPAARVALGEHALALAPALDGLESLSVHGGRVRLSLSAPATIPSRKATLLLAREVSFTVRGGAGAEGALEEVQGVEARTLGLTCEVQRLEVGREGGQRVAKAEVRLGFFRRTLRFELGPVEGLSGVVTAR